jgi:hypothetical protein
MKPFLYCHKTTLIQYTAAAFVVKAGCETGSHTAAYKALMSSEDITCSLEFNSPASARSRRCGLSTASIVGSSFLNLSWSLAKAGNPFVATFAAVGCEDPAPGVAGFEGPAPIV